MLTVHGLQRIAQALSDIDAIGVARVDEALQLRNAGITRPIVLLEGFFRTPSQIPIFNRQQYSGRSFTICGK